MRRFLVLTLLAALLAQPALIHAGKVGPAQGPKIYSNVRYHKDTGDLLGDELILVIIGSDVSATLNDFEGGTHPIQSVFRGTLVANRLRLRGKSEFGRFRLTGTMEGTLLVATITSRRVGQPATVRVAKLRLMKHCVYSTCGGPPE
jgi:hypothetical protein